MDACVLKLTVGIVLGNLKYQTGQAYNTNQVRDCHESVEGVGKVDSKLCVKSGACQNDKDKDNLVNHEGLGAEQVLPCLAAVEAPAKDGGVSKEGNGDCNKDTTEYTKVLGESFGRKTKLRCAADGSAGLKVNDAGGQYNKSGHGTYNDGIEEHFKDTPQTLYNRFFNV